MKFPGENSLKISHEAVQVMLERHIAELIQESGCRVTRVRQEGYPPHLVVDFTTDPEEVEHPIPEPAPITPPNAADVDDDHPF
jgi:hypothetical protein